MNHRRPADFAGLGSLSAGGRGSVIVVGGGDSGAQIAADLALAGDVTVTVTWATRRAPRFLPDDIDGRVLFDVATARRHALDAGRGDTGGVASLGDIIALPRSAPPVMPDSSRRSRCSPGSPPPASDGPTAAGPKRTRSSGAPASGRPSPTLPHRACAGRAATSRPPAPVPSPSRACSGTATGPARPPRPSSASAGRPGTRPARSPSSWSAGGGRRPGTSGYVRTGLRRSTRTTSRQTPWWRPIRSRVPMTRNPAR